MITVAHGLEAIAESIQLVLALLAHDEPCLQLHELVLICCGMPRSHTYAQCHNHTNAQARACVGTGMGKAMNFCQYRYTTGNSSASPSAYNYVRV